MPTEWATSPHEIILGSHVGLGVGGSGRHLKIEELLSNHVSWMGCGREIAK